MVRIPPFRRLAGLLILSLALAAPPSAWSAPPEAAWHTSAPVVVEPFARLWDLFASLWLKGGCGIDPDGRCTSATTEGGCGVDPNGECATTATSEGGCLVDPNGQCVGGR